MADRRNDRGETPIRDRFGDRFGLGWRRELCAGILANLDRIDLVEVIADDLFDASRAERRAIRTLAAQVPVVFHGVTLGLASAAPAAGYLLDKMARLCDEIEPHAWSEHLAFVRGGGIEIGHLTAAPRTRVTIEGAISNLERAREVIGSAPQVENIATLIEPPASEMSEAEWTAEIVRASGCDMLLDLHNLYANYRNFGGDPLAFIDRVGADRIASIHLAGGRLLRIAGGERLVDDHLHDVPDAVFDLLEQVGARTRRPLNVIIERDGCYPPIESLLAELDRARAALARGRARLIERSEEAA